MVLPSLVKHEISWLIGLIVTLSLTVLINGQALDGNQGNNSSVPSVIDNNNVNQETNSTSPKGISIPKVQTRFFRWIMNGLQDQPNGGVTGSSASNRQGSSFNFDSSNLGANLGFGTQMDQSMRPPMGPPMRPPMGPPPRGPPPMGPPPMGPPMDPSMGSASGTGSQSMGWSQGGQNSRLPPNGQPMGPQGGSGYNQNGQFNGQMGGPVDNLSTGDYGDYEGGDFFNQLGSFFFGTSNSNGGSSRGYSNDYNNGYNNGYSSGTNGGSSCGGGDRGRVNSNVQQVQSSSNGAQPSSTSSMGMSSEDWSNYIKLIQTLASDGGGAGGGGAGGGLGDLSSLMGSASSIMSAFG